MNMVKYLVSALLLVTYLGCAPIKTKLSEDELKWVSVYKPGDTLIFKSQYGIFDTSFIVSNSIFYPEYTPVETHGKYLPHTGIVIYRNKNLQYRPQGDKLVYIYKTFPNKGTRLFLDYLNSSVIVLDVTSGSINQFKHGKVYEFDTFHPKARPNEPKVIFWHEDLGIIKYITHAEEIWERINMPNDE